MNYTRTLIHILLWLSYFLILVYTSSQALELETSIIMGFRTISLHAFLFYANTEILIPQILEKRKYLYYVLSILGLLGLTMLILRISYEIPVIKGAFESMRAMRPNKLPAPEIIPRWFISNLVSFMSILFISTLYSLINISRKKEEQEMAKKNETLQSELKFLKSQISPHFLFNALNNIYALSFTGSEKTPEMILKLSNMLRYGLYDCNESKVPLSLELAYLLNYIDLQKIKEETEPNIRFNYLETNGNLKIDPMMLIPFIENSFKHSKIENSKDGYIRIDLKTEGNKLLFKIENSLPDVTHNKDKVGGIGLINVKRRLELLYPNRHELVVKDLKDKFSVTLELDTYEN